MKYVIAIVFAGFLAASMGCAQEVPLFLERIVSEHEAESSAVTEGASAKLEVWQYEYQGKTVFYLPFAKTHCCDALSMVYDSEGTMICMPEGGITGRGDGRCADFATARSRGELVYGGTASDRQRQ